MQHFTFSIRFKSEFLLGHAIQNFHGARRNRSLAFAVCDIVHGPIVHEHGWFCGGWLSMCGTAWVWRTSLKFRQAVMIALDLDQWQFAIMGKEPQYHDGSVSVGISSLDRGRMERFNGTFFDALRVPHIGPTMQGYLLLSFRGYQRFALLAFYEGNPPVTGQRPVARSFDVFFDLRLNKKLSKQSRRLWFETPSRSSWRHCNELAKCCETSEYIAHAHLRYNSFVFLTPWGLQKSYIPLKKSLIF